MDSTATTPTEHMPSQLPDFVRPDFVSDLERLCAEGHLIAPGRRTSSRSPGVPHEALVALDQALTKDRQEQEKRLKGRVEKLRGTQPDHPIFCPVSLLGTLSYGLYEPAHTQALRWFLDPMEKHGFERTLTDALLELVKLSPKRFSDVKLVQTELMTEEKYEDGAQGRIDILITLTESGPDGERTHHIGIEVKIRAEVRTSQLRLYENDIAKPRTLVLLTRDEIKDDDISEEWRRIRFRQLTCAFTKCLPHLKNTPGYDFLRYYLAGLYRDVLGYPVGSADPSKMDPYSALIAISDVG